MKLAIIAAIGKNRVIGTHGKIPWHLSDDLKRFKRLTTGHTVVMGRKTWESLGKPLANRRNVVITSASIQGVETFPTLQATLAALKNDGIVFVIGGARLYAGLLPHADILHLTFVDQSPEGDAFFPPYEEVLAKSFREVFREDHSGYSFVDYERKS
jgi:dihydrofolate reductase